MAPISSPDAAGRDDAEHPDLAMLSWVRWYNEQRLHSHCNDLPPTEHEAAFYAAQETHQTLLASKAESLHQTRGGSG